MRQYALLLTTFFALNCIEANADDITIYHSQDGRTAEEVDGYSKTNQSVSRYIAYRDIPPFIDQYVMGTTTLDDGAGTGYSTQFLQEQGLDVIGVDVSKEMLAQARINCPDTPFYLVENGSLPLESESVDLVFSSLVLFELSSEQDVVAYLEEAKRVMKEDGILIAVSGSEHMYSKEWFIFDVDYPENKHLQSGDLAKVLLRDAGIEFTDYYWTEADCRRFFDKAGFELLEVHYPLGKEEEPYPWKDETEFSPFVVLVAKKP